MMKNAISYKFGISEIRKVPLWSSIEYIRKALIPWIGAKPTPNSSSLPAEIIIWLAGTILRRKLPSVKAQLMEESFLSSGQKNYHQYMQSATKIRFQFAPLTIIFLGTFQNGTKCQSEPLFLDLNLPSLFQSREGQFSLNQSCLLSQRIVSWEEISKPWVTPWKGSLTRKKTNRNWAVW